MENMAENVPVASQKDDNESLQTSSNEEQKSKTSHIDLTSMPEESGLGLLKLPDPEFPEGHPYHGMKGKYNEQSVHSTNRRSP